MPNVSIYLNFSNQTEEAFGFYKAVFGGDFSVPIQRFGEVPAQPGTPALSEADKHLVLHVVLPIMGGFRLMGTDAPESMGLKVKVGNNVHITLEPDSRAEADRLFTALSAGGQVTMTMRVMFWGDYYGAFTDRFGVCWMINCAAKQ